MLGPTGTGKSEVALLAAERLDGEIVGCDAIQVYRGLDAATAKPLPQHRARVPHHLIDVADPHEDYDMASYVQAAGRAIEAIAARGRVPVVVGGTGMYLRGLLQGIVEAPPRDPALRDRLRAMATRHGARRLHRWLRRLDPASAERLAPGDTQRIVRAVEIALSGGRPWSQILAHRGTWAGTQEKYAALKIGLDLDRKVLGERLDARVRGFFAAGLVREVRELLRGGVPESVNAFKAIGYREVLEALRAGLDPESVVEEVVASTRRYAKRQRTWFRKEAGVVWLVASEGPEAVADRIVALWGESRRK